ncbi:imidazolonepropionase [Spongorhabdus nitratireducens]
MAVNGVPATGSSDGDNTRINNVPIDRAWINARLSDRDDQLYIILTRSGLIHDVIPSSAETVAALQSSLNAASIIDVAGGWVTPGLIDCHTHLVFAGHRANEFEQRLQGVSYETIARQGGGIMATVQQTRKASFDELLKLSMPRVQALIDQGVTTVEIKSGYGLELETELKMLRAARELESRLPVRVSTTFLGAHALPPEYHNNADGYIDFLCREVLPAVATEQLADAVDMFCEGIGFSVEQCRRLFEVAAKHGLPVKGHTEQLSCLGGTRLVSEFKGLSADHLEYLDEAGVKAMAQAGTVAVLLPGAFYYLRETKLPPIELLRQYGVPMAIATDFNPGSSPLLSLRLMMNMACVLFGLTPDEALKGVTVNAAQALGLQDMTGKLLPGMQADFCVWNISCPAELASELAVNTLHQRVFAGEPG